MSKFDISNYTITLLRIYKGVKEETSRLADDLEYYFLEETDKNKYLYLVNANKTDIFIIYKTNNTDWTRDKIHLILSNTLKKTHFIAIDISGYYGSMKVDFWEEIKECDNYFSNVKKFRKKYKDQDIPEIQKEVITDIKLLTIDEILNKINKQGINSLTDNEKEILNKNKE